MTLSLRVVALASVLIARLASAQFIQGLVVAERDKRLLPGVRVVLLDSQAAVVKAAETDSAAGAFYFDVRAPGKFQLLVYDRLGNSFASPAFNIGADSTVERVLVLPDLPPSYADLPLVALTPLPQPPWRKVFPRFPDAQRRMRQTGVVFVSVIVDGQGQVVTNSEYIAVSSHPDFARAVQAVVDNLQFPPASDVPRPPRVIVNRIYTFNVFGQAERHCPDICILAYTEPIRAAPARPIPRRLP